MAINSELIYENKDINDLIPYARNARVHTDSHIAQIAGSIREFGFNVPVLIDETGNIIAGHGRVLAARKLGMKEVPVVIAGHLTDTQRRAYIIADNKLHDNSTFDYETLQLDIDELKAEGFDMGLAGFEEFELQGVENYGQMNDLDDNVFSGHIGRESDEFSITFVFPKEKEDQFNTYLQENTKAKLTEQIIGIVTGD